MINAAEAKQLTRKNLTREIDEYVSNAEKAIEAGIKLGKFDVIITYKSALFKDLVNKLSGLGYTVVKQSQSCSGYEVKISWENA